MELFQPVGPIERGLVQSLVDTRWRLERIPGLEYALIENNQKAMNQNNTPEISIELNIRIPDERTFRNLHLQEGRLVRRREKEMKELRELQASRKAQEEAELKQAAELALVAEQNQQPFEVSTLGFVFSTDRFAQYMARLTPSMKQISSRRLSAPPPAQASAPKRRAASPTQTICFVLDTMHSKNSLPEGNDSHRRSKTLAEPVPPH